MAVIGISTYACTCSSQQRTHGPHSRSSLLLTDIVLVLIDLCAPCYCRPLHLAVSLTSQPDIVEILLENGAEMNAQNNTGMTPLITACQANSIHSASKLVENGIMCTYNVM